MSEAKINMSLDQIIQKNKTSGNKRGRGGLRGGNSRGSGNTRGAIRGGRGSSRGGRKLSNQNIPRRMDNKRNNYNNIRGGRVLNNRRRGRFGSERRIIENNGPRNMRNKVILIIFLF
jgi:hypothetical protein